MIQPKLDSKKLKRIIVINNKNISCWRIQNQSQSHSHSRSEAIQQLWRSSASALLVSKNEESFNQFLYKVSLFSSSRQNIFHAD
jgi:hypothetical protein